MLMPLTMNENPTSSASVANPIPGLATITTPAITSTAATTKRHVRRPSPSNANTKRTVPIATSQMPINIATTVTPAIGWRIRTIPTIRFSTPSNAAKPRFSVSLLSDANSSTRPSKSTKIPVITASVARLLLGLARTIAPVTI